LLFTFIDARARRSSSSPLGVEAAVDASVEAVEQLLGNSGALGGLELQSPRVASRMSLAWAMSESVARSALSAIVKGGGRFARTKVRSAHLRRRAGESGRERGGLPEGCAGQGGVRCLQPGQGQPGRVCVAMKAPPPGPPTSLAVSWWPSVRATSFGPTGPCPKRSPFPSPSRPVSSNTTRPPSGGCSRARYAGSSAWQPSAAPGPIPPSWV
jgi:hypothetical protein